MKRLAVYSTYGDLIISVDFKTILSVDRQYKHITIGKEDGKVVQISFEGYLLVIEDL